MGKPQLRYTSRWHRFLIRIGLKQQLKVYTPARQTRVHPAQVFHFTCEDCGETWEKGLYRSDSTHIRCHCGGKGVKLHPVGVV